MLSWRQSSQKRGSQCRLPVIHGCPKPAVKEEEEEDEAVLELSATPVWCSPAPLLQARGKLGLSTLRSCCTGSSSILFKVIWPKLQRDSQAELRAKNHLPWPQGQKPGWLHCVGNEAQSSLAAKIYVFENYIFQDNSVLATKG